MRALYVAGGVAAILAANAGCGSSTPVAASPAITEQFSGTVLTAGNSSNNFTVAKYGEVDITLTAAGPPSTITVGMAIGTVAGGSCSIGSVTSGSTNAQSTPQFAGNMDPGAYCVTIFDVGNIGPTPIVYSVTVAHP